MSNLKFIGLLLLGFLSFGALADEDSLPKLVKNAILESFPGAQVELQHEIKWTRKIPANEAFTKVSMYETDGRGNAHFLAVNEATGFSAEGWVGFSAWQTAQVALRRIRPGETVTPDLYTAKNIPVSYGTGYEYRGLIFGADADLKGLEAIQTVMEGQPIYRSSVQRAPDVRRGDAVLIHLVSGRLVLSTSGIAGESAYINKKVRAIANKGKRELLGTLMPGGIVEVNL